MSSHSLLASPALESLVTIEIEPVMVESVARLLAWPAVFDDPRSVHIYNDAKAYFAATNRKFDIIVAEPSNPWVSGVSGLFTRSSTPASSATWPRARSSASGCTYEADRRPRAHRARRHSRELPRTTASTQ